MSAASVRRTHQTTVLLVDDHPLFCRALRQLIDAESDLRVVAEAHSGESGLKLARELHPGVMLLDVEMPSVDGFAVAVALRRESVPTRVVFLTMHRSAEMFNAAMDAGALGYVLKDTAHCEVVPCLRQVAEGRRYVSPSITDFLFERGERARGLVQARPGVQALTPSERVILKLISQDRTSKEIADELGISPHTVTNHRANICAKLQLRGSHSLLKFAYDQKSAL